MIESTSNLCSFKLTTQSHTHAFFLLTNFLHNYLLHFDPSRRVSCFLHNTNRYIHIHTYTYIYIYKHNFNLYIHHLYLYTHTHTHTLVSEKPTKKMKTSK
ncbi:hypothetical protein QVD17_17444 [Tagetes erecta]|uniref:Uncharacterized protein n=1 Tax=Tagetes erecta TaxID=13708 RepID=A0AAD8KZH8_TARER|nr:hypothetical protein QVD17_17444 [Tagetes erecta]